MLHVLTPCCLKYSAHSVKLEFEHQEGVSDMGIIRIEGVV